MLARKTTPPHRGYDPVRLDRRAQASDLEHFEDEAPTRPTTELPVAMTRPVEPLDLEWEDAS